MGPPKLRSPGSANPSPGFCPCSPQEKQKKNLCVPGTHSPSHLSSEPPLSKGPAAPCLAFAPLPRLPPTLPLDPPQFQPQPSGHSGLAERSQRAPPGPGGHCLLSAPNPPPSKRAATNSAAGGGSARRERLGRAKPARPPPPLLRPAPPHLALLRGGVPAARDGRRAPEAKPLGAVPLEPRWWAPRGSGASAPFVTTAAGTEGLETVKSVKLPAARSWGFYCCRRGLVGRPITGRQLLQAAFTASRAVETFVSLTEVFLNELEEGREGTRPRAAISSPNGEVSTGKLQVTAPPPYSSPAGRYPTSEKQLCKIAGLLF